MNSYGQLFFLSSLQDMIHIADTKVDRRYGDFFIRNIHKLDEVRPPFFLCFCILIPFSTNPTLD